MTEKFIGIVLFALLFAPVVGWADSPYDRAAYYDADYTSAWVGNPVEIRDALDAAGYTILDADALKTWMDGHIADGKLSVVVFCQDVVPGTVAESNTEDCTLRQYLDAGGKIVWTSDIPFYYVCNDGTNTTWSNGGSAGILGFQASPSSGWDTGDTVTITEEGITWGLTETWSSNRPLPVDSWERLTVLALDDVGNAAAWVAHYVEGDTYRGFVRTSDFSGNTASIADLIALAEYAENVEMATTPVPESEIVDVPRDVVLGWSPGFAAVTHDVYFGTSFDDVNTASRDNPLGVLVSQDQTANTYDPEGLLEFGTTYYWRIDEVNGAPDYTIFRGEVWSFTAEPFAYPVANITATSNVASDAGAGPENTINGSGLNEMDQHSTDSADMWQVTPATEDPLYIQYEFDRVYKLHEMLVWNYNVAFEALLGFGLKNVTVEHSENGTDWVSLGEVELAQATANTTYTANTTIDFAGVGVQYVRLTVNSAYGSTGRYGLSEVRFLYIPAQPREPQPADGTTNVDVSAALAWRAGRDAVTHEVYLGTDPDALELAGTPDAASYDPGALNLDVTYYWKVDETSGADGLIWTGDVWSFSTQEYLVVDDFESYNDEDNLIYETWIDGWVNGTGSTVGHAVGPFAERTVVHGGSQSMPLYYDNAGVDTSEADLDLGQDWAANGIQTLSLQFHGDPGNSGGQLYVTINGAKVPYDGDAADITVALWHPWNIDLSSVSGLANVGTLTIGIEGDGAQGIVYVDDIRLYPRAVEYITPTEPDTASLVARYALDGNPNDSSGNGYNGTEVNGPTYVAGMDGQAMKFDGVDDYVDLGNPTDWPAGTAPRTMSLWARTNSVEAGYRFAVAYGTAGTSLAMFIGINGTTLYGGGYGDDVTVADFWVQGEWHHLALTYDGITARLYADGVEAASAAKTWNLTLSRAHIGQQINDLYEFWNGTVDEVRIYRAALSAAEVAWLAGKTTPMHKPF